MSASISLLRSRRKVLEDCDDSGEESDCSIKDVQKKESIEKDARAIAAINMLTVSMVNQLLEQQGLDPFGKALGSPSLDDSQTWTTPLRSSSRPSITRSIKENTLVKKSRKSVRFTPDCNRNDFTPERSCDMDRTDLTHTRTASLSSLKMEPKFTPLRRSKVLKAGMLRSLENEQDVDPVDNYICSNDSFDSPLPIRNLAVTGTAQVESMEDFPQSPVVEVVSQNDTLPASNQGNNTATSVEETAAPEQSKSPLLSCQNTQCEGNKDTTVSNPNQSVNESDKNELLCETPVKPKWTHHFDPTSPEHMSPFLKTLLEERAERGQGKELSKSVSLLEDSEDQPRLSVLKGVVAYVEVIRADEDRSSGFRWKLKQLGAQVEENFTKKVTHVVFQEGLLSTYRKAKESNVHLVSAFWVMACDESSSRVPEDKYPIDEEDKYSMLAPLKKYIRRPKLMSPDLGDGNDEKRLARRLQAIKRRSMKIEGSPIMDKETNDGAVAHSSKTNPDRKSPQHPKRASMGKKSGESSTGGSSSLMNAWLTGKKKPVAEKVTVKTEASPTPSELRNSTVSTTSPRKRTADIDSTDSPLKLKGSSRTFDSPMKTKSSATSVESPSKTKSSSRSFESILETKLSARSVESPLKTKSSARSVASPLKTKSSSRSVKSPLKTKSSARSVESPLKTKSSARSVEFPLKTKSSARSVESPLKTKSSARSVETPLKTKSSARSVETPVKAKLYCGSLDSPLKTISSAAISDSPKKTKASSKVIDSSKSTSAASPVRSKANLNSTDNTKLTPKKRSSDKDSRSPVKRSLHWLSSTAMSEDSGRVLRSTPKKSTTQYSSTLTFSSEERRTFEKTTKSIKSSGKVCLASWLSANKDLPAKRSLDGEFKSVVSDSAGGSKTSATSKTDSDSNNALTSDIIEETDSQSQVSEAPKKKARVEPSSKKRLKEEKAENVSQKPSKFSCKRKSSSECAKLQRGSVSVPSRAKEKRKKTSPRGKGKLNDMCQTVMTSHFRRLGESTNKDKNVVTEMKEESSENKTVLAQSMEEGRTVQTNPPQHCEEIEAAIPLQCRPTVVINCEKPTSCSSTDPILTLKITAPEELQTFPSKSENLLTCADLTDEQGTSTAVRKEPRTIAGVYKEQLNAAVLDESEKASVVFDEEPALADVVEEQPTGGMLKEQSTLPDVCEKPLITAETTCTDALEKQRITIDVRGEKSTSADRVDEPGETADVCEKQTATDDVLKEPMETADTFEEGNITADLLEEPMIPAGACEEESLLADALEEPMKTVDAREEQTATADVLREPMKTVDASEEQSILANVLEEPMKTADVCEEQTATTIVLEEPMKTADMCEEQTATSIVLEVPMKIANMCEEQTATSIVLEEPMKTADVCEEQTATFIVLEEPMKTEDVCKEQTATSIVLEVPMKIANMCEEQTATSIVLEEPMKTPDVCEEQTATSIGLKEPMKIADTCEEQTATSVVLEEPIKTPDVCEEQTATSGVLEEPIKTPDVCEEQTATSGVLEEPIKTRDVCEGLTATTGLLEMKTVDGCKNQQVSAYVLSDKSSGYVSRDEQDCTYDSFSSLQESARSENSNESCSKRSRKSVKSVNKSCHYRTRRSMRFVADDATE